MSDRLAWIAAAWIGLCLAAATLLLNAVGSGGLPIAEAARLPWLSGVLTIPISLTEMAELRTHVLSLGLAGLLLLQVVARRRLNGAGTAHSGAGIVSTSVPDRTPGWFRWLALFLVAWSAASALANGALELSTGWIFQLACGLGWAAVLARFASPGIVRRLFAITVGIIVIATVVTFWHRHVFGYRYVRWPIGPITLCSALGAIWLLGSIGAIVGKLLATRTTKRSDSDADSNDTRPASASRISADPTNPASDSPEAESLRHPSLPLASAGVHAARSVLAAIAVAAAGLALLLVSGRRSAYVGAISGACFVAVLVATCRLSARATRLIALGAAGAVIVSAAAFAHAQRGDHRRETSGSLSLRFTYWRTMFAGIVDRPLFGVGPDMFVCAGATALARDRAEMPHVLHGDVEPSGHNEWLQAAYELGLPGGMAYLLLPTLVLLSGVQAWRACRDANRRGHLLACMAALVALLVTESASVNMRYPIVQAWYWTCIGLLLASARGAAPAARSMGASPAPLGGRAGIAPFPYAAVAIAIACLSLADLRAGVHHARGRALLEVDAARAFDAYRDVRWRLGATRWLAARNEQSIAGAGLLGQSEAAASQSELEKAQPGNHELLQRALDACAQVYAVSPAYPGMAARYAGLLIRANQTDRARVILQKQLESFDPYDPAANDLFARRFAPTATERLDCVLRSLRATSMTAEAAVFVSTQLGEAGIAEAWRARVSGAERDLVRPDDADWSDALAPEVARLHAALLDAEGDAAAAAAWQLRAAECYKRLDDSNRPRRRPAVPVADAWRWAAERTFRADPSRYREAADCAESAERYAVLGMAHEYLRDPDPSVGFVGGVVLPVEAPDHFRPVWQTAAKFRMAAGRMDNLDRRIRAALPPSRQSGQDLVTALRFLASELVDSFESIPADRRPPNYADLLTWAGRRSSPIRSTQPAPGQSAPSSFPASRAMRSPEPVTTPELEP